MHGNTLILALLAFLTASCGGDGRWGDYPDSGAQGPADGGGGVGGRIGDEPPTPPSFDDDTDGGARDYSRPPSVCWVACYLGPCLLRCDAGEVPVENAAGNAWHCEVDTGQCDGVDFADDAGTDIDAG